VPKFAGDGNASFGKRLERAGLAFISVTKPILASGSTARLLLLSGAFAKLQSLVEIDRQVDFGSDHASNGLDRREIVSETSTRGAVLGLIGCPQISNCKSCEWHRKNVPLDLCGG
jgi:hypothetical protein